MPLDSTDLKRMYRKMVFARVFEETAGREFKKGNIPGWIHLSIGHEGVLVGCSYALKKSDYFFTDHRSYIMTALMGTPGEKVMAEIFGKSTGICKGKGGEMHIADPEVGSLGNNEIQGANLATCLGTAFASKIRGTNQVTAVFFGDGTVGRGEFHESLNMASVWKLPIVYVCVNNLYAISTHVRDAHPVEDLSLFASGYKIPSKIVDGNDVIKVYKSMKKAIEYVRAGNGPYFLEYKTYRWQGHFLGDPASYRPEEEVKWWKQRCPIKRLREKLLNEKILNQHEIEKIHDQIENEIENMVEFAINSPFPEETEAIKDVFDEWGVEGR